MVFNRSKAMTQHGTSWADGDTWNTPVVHVKVVIHVVHHHSRRPFILCIMYQRPCVSLHSTECATSITYQT